MKPRWPTRPQAPEKLATQAAASGRSGSPAGSFDSWLQAARRDGRVGRRTLLKFTSALYAAFLSPCWLAGPSYEYGVFRWISASRRLGCSCCEQPSCHEQSPLRGHPPRRPPLNRL